jgi:hypothetical protein
VAANARPASVTVRGLVAGVAGTAALSAFERLEWALLGGRMAIYAPASVGRGLAGRWLAGTVSPRRDARLGYALRWLYGPSLGILFATARPLFPQTPVAAGVCLGAGIFAVEFAAMPAVGATPPIRRWSRLEPGLLILHTAVFGVVTAVTADFLIGKSTRAWAPHRRAATSYTGQERHERRR